ncbi:uncharacterized protein LOC135090674 [Scylla paramamosain]|uniref:uncharacterized protein LOC135090674 n=1 Tax=Scylla paramamosain TaxID=85552 RepID=UPI0030831261
MESVKTNGNLRERQTRGVLQLSLKGSSLLGVWTPTSAPEAGSARHLGSCEEAVGGLSRERYPHTCQHNARGKESPGTKLTAQGSVAQMNQTVEKKNRIWIEAMRRGDVRRSHLRAHL